MLEIGSKVVYRWLGHERIGIIKDIFFNSNNKKKKIYKVQCPVRKTIYILGLDNNENKFGRILKEETEKYNNGEYMIKDKKQDTPLDMKFEELENLFEEIKHLHNTSRSVELRKKIVQFKQELTNYRKLTLQKK